MLIEISKIQFIGTQEVKSFNKPCGHEPYWRLCYYLNRKKKKWFNIQRLQAGPIDFTSPRTHMS